MVCKCLTNINEFQQIQFFKQGEIQWHTSAPCPLSCQMLFCQTVQLLSLTRQKNCRLLGGRINLYYSTSNIMGKHNKIEDITFKWTPVYVLYKYTYERKREWQIKRIKKIVLTKYILQHITCTSQSENLRLQYISAFFSVSFR